jgi:hypothetical protein
MKGPCPLEEGHDTSGFDCGVEALDTYLKRYARQTQKPSSSSDLLQSRDDVVFYPACTGDLNREYLRWVWCGNPFVMFSS